MAGRQCVGQMKQERRQNEWHNRVERLQKPDGLSEARDSSHGFFTGLLTYANEHNMPDIAGYNIQQIQKGETPNTKFHI